MFIKIYLTLSIKYDKIDMVINIYRILKRKRFISLEEWNFVNKTSVLYIWLCKNYWLVFCFISLLKIKMNGEKAVDKQIVCNFVNCFSAAMMMIL